MKTKIFLLSIVLIFAFSCSKNNPLDSSNNGTTIANYEGTYTGKAQYTIVTSPTRPKEEDVSLIVNKNATAVFKTNDKSFDFDNFVKTDDKSYNSIKKEGDSLIIFSVIFDGNGNVNVSLIIQSTSEKYTADKLTKTAS